jgi:ParB family chromosome partitioning protein
MAETRQLRLDELFLGEVNVRRDVGDLSELTESIKAQGVVQALTVRPVGDRFEIVAGRRRFEAARKAGLETIPAVIREVDDLEAINLSFQENQARQNLSLEEQALVFERLEEELGSLDAVANFLRISQAVIRSTLDAYEAQEKTGVKVEPRTVKVAPTEPVSMPKAVAASLSRTLRSRQVERRLRKLPEPERQAIERKLGEAVAEDPDLAPKILKKFKREPTRPVEELVEEAEEEPEPITATVYFSKEVSPFVLKEAEKNTLSVGKWITLLVEHHLKDLGYKWGGQQRISK